MEKIIEKIETFIDETIENFEKNPLKMSLKLIAYYLILKFIWKTVNKK